jgi:hypothetical protein
MALQSRMQLARPRGVRLGCRVLGCRVGSMGLGATKGVTGRYVPGNRRAFVCLRYIFFASAVRFAF